jgi:hypothetical protein
MQPIGAKTACSPDDTAEEKLSAYSAKQAFGDWVLH